MKKILLVLLFGVFCLSADAYDEYYAPDTNPTFKFDVFNEGETVLDFHNKPLTSTFTLNENQREAILDAAKTWNNILNTSPNPNKLPTYAITTIEENNAYAGVDYVPVTDSSYLLTQINALVNNKTTTGEYSDINSYISIGEGLVLDHPGWNDYTGPYALYHGELPDLYSATFHEMYHTLGLSNNAQRYVPNDSLYYFSKDASSPIGIWDAGLRIYTNDMYEPFDASQIIAAEPGMSVNTSLFDDGTFDIDNYTPYFAGMETLKVLTGLDDTEENMQEYIFSKGGLKNYSRNIYPWVSSKVLGLPVNTVEYGPELSHIELRNSFMSHQLYQNWGILMEAELAVLKDIGYTNVDLRKFYGKSYYLDNITDTFSTGYGEWNGSSYNGYSSVTNGIGLHIYGSFSSITQNSDTLSNGKAAIGTRLEGTDNTYTLNNSLIDVKGDDSIGVAVTWGKGHTVNIDADSTVSATGKDSIGVSFDFGKHVEGALHNDVGSYSFYRASWKEDVTPKTETQGALIENFNVEGTIIGSKAAIYTSENAYVKNINIKNGAEINGDIISKWNSVKSGINMSVQRKNTDGKWVPVDINKPEEIYSTSLNFSGDTVINGNITGENDIKNTLNMTNATGSAVNFNGEEINVNSLDNKGDINISKNASVTTAENSITGDGNLNILSGASLVLSSNITNIENALNFNNASFDTINGSINSVVFSKMTLSGDNSMSVDIDVASQTSDTLKFNNPSDLTVNLGAGLNISKVNLINPNVIQTYTNEKYYIPFVSSANNNQNLLGKVSYAGVNNILTPIFKYNFGYTEDNTQGGFLFSRGATKKYGSYNPAVAVSPVAAQFGGYLNQLNSYEQAFQNLDMKMLMTREERKALKMANLYASNTPKVFSPTYLPEKDKGMWFKPYTTFEKADLRNGPKVENISYGSYFGGDSPMFTTKNGWDYQYSVYAGYNGSHQNYSGNSIYQNGGTLGATAIWYKNDFFTALTANAGAGAADASTMYGSEDMTMLMTGVASKTGYNRELAKGKFIIQPSYLMSYSFVNTFDYTNAAGLKIKSDPLNAINITPGLKFIGNLKNGWQPYMNVQMVWNIMDKTDFRANNVALPDMSVKPYVQYGVGIQKRWGERFTGFFQTMLRNGGRNGVALTLGFRWTLGK